MRPFAFLATFFLAASLWAADESTFENPEPLEVEPPLLIHETPDHPPGQATNASVSDGESNLEQIQNALEKARKRAEAGERLFRRGVIAKVEAESRDLKVVRLEADLANAQFEAARQHADLQQRRYEMAEISQKDLEAANVALVAARKEAEAALARRDKAELEAAFLNLRRQKQLLAAGSGRSSEVRRAEERVASLQHPQE